MSKKSYGAAALTVRDTDSECVQDYTKTTAALGHKKKRHRCRFRWIMV